MLLEIIVKVHEESKFNYADTTRHSIASQRIGSRDFWRISYSPQFPLFFSGSEVLTSSTDKANLFARTFSANSVSTTRCTTFLNRKTSLWGSLWEWLQMQSVNLMWRKPLVLTAFLYCPKDVFSRVVSCYCWAVQQIPVWVTLPSCWKFSSVVPANKNDGERSNPGNYRPYQPSFMKKILKSFVNDRISKYLERSAIFSDLQYGFRAFRSTADLLTVLSERIYNSFDVGGETWAIALIISKAFWQGLACWTVTKDKSRRC